MSNILLNIEDGFYYWLFTTIEGKSLIPKELIYTVLHVTHKMENPQTYKGVIMCWVDYVKDSLENDSCKYKVTCEVISIDKYIGRSKEYWLYKLLINGLQMSKFRSNTKKFVENQIVDTTTDPIYEGYLAGFLEEIITKLHENKVELMHIQQKFPF